MKAVVRYDESVHRVSVRVKPQAYEAVIGSGLLSSAADEITAALGRASGSGRAFVVTVPPVRKHWEKTLLGSLKKKGIQFHVLEMRNGERYKNISTVEQLAEKMVKLGADRGSFVIALGGGVVGDVSGMLASIYMRGIPCIQVPTTFLAQVDASVGGKTAVNLASGKNLLGTFHQPRLVLADIATLATLPEREYRSGLYEALKCGVIRNAAIFDFMEKERERVLARDPAALEWLITECIRVKAEVVEADERENDLRRILNFGHTIGHALEAETSYRYFLHGEAVAWGMVAASMIAAAMQKTSAETAQRIINSVLAYATLPKVEVRSKNIARRILSDKKTANGVTHFVLPSEIGKVQISSEVPQKAVLQAVDELRYLSHA
ncbi:MAG TPA: 3-dehydroquinate synthase [Terriglobales bacterium]|nr:3-dehydroquinate synthase [Terriglobales bacterium]